MKIYKNYMFRPIIYMTATRLMAALIFLFALPYFVKNGPVSSIICAFLAMLFALFAFLVYLRMDGLRIPRVKFIRPKKKNDPARHFASMSDYTNEEPPVTFDELEPEEKDFCSLASSLVNLLIFLILSFVI